jgi:cold shock CspA family protein
MITKTGSIALLSGVFGFISPDDGTADAWFRMQHVVAGVFLHVGDRVSFLPFDGPKGPRAKGVRRLDEVAA